VTDAGHDRPPFDERAALAELERLREQIVQLRSKRVAAGTEFDGFVRSLKTRETAPIAATRDEFSPMTVPGDLDSKPVEPPPAPSVDHEPVPAVPSARRQPGARNLVLLGSALLLLATGGLVTWTLRKGGREAIEPDRVVSAQPPATSAPDAPPAAPRPIPVSPYDSQIVTSRPVWVRVVADGQRVVERELPALARVPFKATRSIVIRAGDAGALRLSIGGRDQGPLGADGVVVTRTFSVSGPVKQ
jgi:cytoskeleton protein RodZ